MAAFSALDLGRYFTLEALKAQRDAIASYREAHPWSAAGAYFALYVAVTGLSLPGAAVLALAGGALFGLLSRGSDGGPLRGRPPSGTLPYVF